MCPSRRPARLWALAVPAALALTLAGAGCGGSGDSTTPEAKSKQAAEEAAGNGDWSFFGRVAARTHSLPAKGLDPPLKEVWTYDDGVLLEFPPALADGVLYLTDKAGDIRALRASDGSTIWHRSGTGTSEGAPADTTGAVYAHGRLFVALQNGRVLALRPENGDVEWERRLPSQLEASPLVIRSTVYLGSDKGVLFALDARNGKVRWTYKASDQPVKTSPSHQGGVVYFADYGGTVHAVRASDGKKVWQTSTDGMLGSGGYYSSPALAARKLFIGRDDGAVFGLALDSGKPVWSKQTGEPVIGSPAVAKVRGAPLTVYVGSYDNYLYAFEAASGDVRWRYDVKGPIPGTPTVVGNTVYTSSFKTQETVGVNAKSGKRVYRFSAPGYTPMISDGERLFLIGYESVRGLEPQ
jgi:outer membrane protein assembly factor BamB